MDEENTEVEIEIKAPFLTRALDFETGFKHILAPAFLGVVLGGIWEAFVMPHVGAINLPNPVHGAFFISILLSPLLYRLLLDDEPSRWKEYTLGLSILGLLFSMIWLSGWGGIFCGGYGALLVWVWISTDWGWHPLPPCRWCRWHAFGIGYGTFAGRWLCDTHF